MRTFPNQCYNHIVGMLPIANTNVANRNRETGSGKRRLAAFGIGNWLPLPSREAPVKRPFVPLDPFDPFVLTITGTFQCFPSELGIGNWHWQHSLFRIHRLRPYARPFTSLHHLSDYQADTSRNSEN